MSDREHEEVSEEERQYEDGTDPKLLDLIDVPLLEARPKDYQQENWLLDPGRHWVRAGRASWGDLERLADPEEPLWIDGHSTYNGQNDKIPLALARNLRISLHLIRVERMILSVFTSGGVFGNPRRRVQGRFSYNGRAYWLWVTDPGYESEYKARPNGDYHIGDSFVTVSLGEPFGDECYKLIAAVIERERVGSV